MNIEKSEGPEKTNEGAQATTQAGCSGSLLKSIVLITAGSALLALAINSLRPSKAIDLSRNYFPSIEAPDQPENNLNEADTQQDVVPVVVETQIDDGIQRLTFEDIRDHFMTAEDEFASTGESIVAFVDARVRDQYEDGHIPGAIWLYHYESGDLIDDVRPQLEMAFFIIVYCNGGDCEDSLHLAADLGSLYGLPPENVYVYEGGFNEWKENEMPVKTGSEAR